MFDNGPVGDDLNLRPGEICFIEHVKAGLSMPAQAAIADADIVLYDRSLSAVVAGLLTADAYAEPAAQTDGKDDPAIPLRALRLAADGWRVAYLLQPRPGWHRRLRDAAESIAAASGNGGLPMRLAGTAAGDRPPTVILGPLAAAGPPGACFFTANGLAG